MVVGKLLLVISTACIGLVASLPATSDFSSPSPAELARLIDSNRVVQVEAGRKVSGGEALAAAYAKYGWPKPTTVDHELAERDTGATAVQSGIVKATDLPNDRAYYVNVTLGTNTLLLNMDTGSSDLWGFSTLMPAAQQGKHHLYHLEGKQAPGETWDIEYVEGSGETVPKLQPVMLLPKC